MGYAMGITPNFNNMEYFELIWMHERMAEQRQKENEEQQNEPGQKSIRDLVGGSSGGKRD